MKIYFTEKAVVQMIEIASDVMKDQPGISPADAVRLAIKAAKELIRRGQLKNGVIIGASEK